MAKLRTASTAHERGGIRSRLMPALAVSLASLAVTASPALAAVIDQPRCLRRQR
jgi:hypothetical protein